MIIRAIRNLQADIRLAIILSIKGKFSYQGIADISGVSRGTISKRICRGYNLMQKDIVNYTAVLIKDLSSGQTPPVGR